MNVGGSDGLAYFQNNLKHELDKFSKFQLSERSVMKWNNILYHSMLVFREVENNMHTVYNYLMVSISFFSSCGEWSERCKELSRDTKSTQNAQYTSDWLVGNDIYFLH